MNRRANSSAVRSLACTRGTVSHDGRSRRTAATHAMTRGCRDE